MSKIILASLPPDSPKHVLHVHLDAEFFEAFKIMTQHRRTSVSKAVRVLLARELLAYHEELETARIQREYDQMLAARETEHAL